MRNCSRSSRRDAFSLVEIMVGLSLVTMIAAYLADSFIFAARSEQAVNKKLVTSRALQYLQFRIRRDAKWARGAKVVSPISGSGGSGHGIEFTDLSGKKRTYKWNPQTMLLSLPKIDQPDNTQEEYNQCKFRWVDFNTAEAGNEGVRVLMAPLPMDEKIAQQSEKEVLWGVAMVGRTELDVTSVAHRYAFYNEPAYAP